jgi:hypothetical protein
MAHTYWRLLITMNGPGSSSRFVSVAEWVMYDSAGSPIATTSGTASASATSLGQSPANAFGGGSTTFWLGGANPSVAAPQWLQYQFPSPVDVASFSIQGDTASGWAVGNPQDFSLQYSDDGSTWTTLYSYLGAGYTGSSFIQTFNAANAAPASLGIAWRLLITNVGGGGVAAQISEWKLYDSRGTQITTSAFAGPTSSAASTLGGSLAFNGDGCATYWQSEGAPSIPSPEWLMYEFASSGVSVASFSIQSPSQGPVNFSVQYSYDAITWTTAGIYTAATWTACATQTFSPVNGPDIPPQVHIYVVT